jgi:hypothetical protein
MQSVERQSSCLAAGQAARGRDSIRTLELRAGRVIGFTVPDRRASMLAARSVWKSEEVSDEFYRE